MSNTIEPKKKPKYLGLLILIPIILIGTCNVYINTHQEKSIIKNPQIGDYFVFKGLIGSGDQPFKLKSIKKGSYEFFIPKYEFLNFKIGESEQVVYNLEAQNKLYDPNLVIEIPKSVVDSLNRNSEFSVRIQHSPKVYLKGVFGNARENAVSTTLDKIIGDQKK